MIAHARNPRSPVARAARPIARALLTSGLVGLAGLPDASAAVLPRPGGAVGRKALAIDPETTTALANLTILLLDEYRLEEAEPLVAALREQDPNLPTGFLAAGRLAFQRGDIETATRLFQEAVAANPAAAESALATAIAYAEAEDWDAARQAIRNALRTFVSTDASLVRETQDKRLQLRLDVVNLFDNENEAAPGIPGTGRTVLAGARVRF